MEVAAGERVGQGTIHAHPEPVAVTAGAQRRPAVTVRHPDPVTGLLQRRCRSAARSLEFLQYDFLSLVEQDTANRGQS